MQSGNDDRLIDKVMQSKDAKECIWHSFNNKKEPDDKGFQQFLGKNVVVNAKRSGTQSVGYSIEDIKTNDRVYIKYDNFANGKNKKQPHKNNGLRTAFLHKVLYKMGIGPRCEFLYDKQSENLMTLSAQIARKNGKKEKKFIEIGTNGDPEIPLERYEETQSPDNRNKLKDLIQAKETIVEYFQLNDVVAHNFGFVKDNNKDKDKLKIFDFALCFAKEKYSCANIKLDDYLKKEYFKGWNENVTFLDYMKNIVAKALQDENMHKLLSDASDEQKKALYQYWDERKIEIALIQDKLIEFQALHDKAKALCALNKEVNKQNNLPFTLSPYAKYTFECREDGLYYCDKNTNKVAKVPFNATTSYHEMSQVINNAIVEIKKKQQPAKQQPEEETAEEKTAEEKLKIITQLGIELYNICDICGDIDLGTGEKVMFTNNGVYLRTKESNASKNITAEDDLDEIIKYLANTKGLIYNNNNRLLDGGYAPIINDPFKDTTCYSQCNLYQVGFFASSAIRTSVKPTDSSKTNFKNKEMIGHMSDILQQAIQQTKDKFSGDQYQSFYNTGFIQHVIRFAQKNKGVGNAKIQWFRAHDRDDDAKTGFMIAKALSYNYQEAAAAKNFYTGRTQNLRTDKAVGKRLCRIPAGYTEAVVEQAIGQQDSANISSSIY